MCRSPLVLSADQPLVVGSFGDAASLGGISPDEVRQACDVIEIRLDLISEAGPADWARFTEIPLLFTCRRASEGGAGELDAGQRAERLRAVLGEAALIDIEVASIAEMTDLIADMKAAGVPWIASAHDFDRVPGLDQLAADRMAARHHGASAFKAAVQLGWEMDQLARLGLFLRQSDFPVSLMGMGPLAPVSRVLFAQLGSVLNYGYLGETPTAPGQWSARQLKDAIATVQRA